MTLDQTTIAPIFPMWLIFLLFVFGAASVILQFFLIRRRLGHSRALAISILRLGAIFFLISFALNPSVIAKLEHKTSPTVAILLDTSLSMGQPGQKGKASRLDEARAFLMEGQNPLLKSLSEKYEVKVFELGESLKAVEVDELARLKPGGVKGDLNTAFQELRGKTTLAVLLSDGHLKWDGGQSNLPLFTVPMGNPIEYKDLLIKTVKAPTLVFRGREVVIDVTIRNYGYGGLTLPVLLKDGSKLLTAKNMHIQASPGEVTTSLSFIPDEVGQKNLSISIPQQFGESLVGNNSINLSIKVVRDKIRILMISGNPSMNYRFMRMALKNDPSIDLLSFVILRTPSDILNVPIQELSLIPFPVETLFSKEIKNFDLLIFDNVSYSLYLSPHHLESIRDFVREGGGFAAIGGPHLLDEGRYAVTPIGEMLPVRLVGKEDYRGDSATGVRLSQAGVVHPITRLSSDVAGDGSGLLSFWQDMPSLDGINLLEAKSSSAVLLEAADGTPWPILTVSNYGKGRALALATDYSWKWYMGRVARGKGNMAYLKLVDRMVRWLTKDPDLDPVQITLPENPGSIGKETEIRIKLREGDLAPNLRSPVLFSAFSPDGLKIESKLKPTEQPSEYLGSFLPQKGGIYKIKVETQAGHLEEFMVITGSLESLDAAPDHEQLKMISSSTGGKYLSNADNLLREIESDTQKRGSRFVEEKRSPVWATPFVMAIVLGLLVLEWYFRRRWGLV
jgi:uncharacterized membrane protein